MSRPVVIVSGGTQGIGRDLTLGLARDGWSVVAFGVEQQPEGDSIPRMRDAVDAAGLGATILEADTSSEADVERVVTTALSAYGRIDALVLNAAIGPLGTVLDTPPSAWDRIIEVNLRGPYLCARATIPHMRSAGGGSIVMIGSGAGWGKPNMASYAASKGGLVALAQSMAYDHFHDRIRVNTVIPGGGGITVLTRMRS